MAVSFRGDRASKASPHQKCCHQQTPRKAISTLKHFSLQNLDKELFDGEPSQSASKPNVGGERIFKQKKGKAKDFSQGIMLRTLRKATEVVSVGL
jgi:hypothetical protein